MAFATTLKQYMAAQGMNQAALAGRTGMSPSAISQLINGVNRPRKPTIRLLADVLGCTAGELAGEEGGPPDDFERDVPVAIAARLIGKPVQFVRNALMNWLKSLTAGNTVKSFSTTRK